MAKNKKVQKNVPSRPTDAMLRVSFLEQSAALLTSMSAGCGDAYNSLSKTCLKEMREICYMEQLKLHREIKRNICRACHRIWLPDRSGVPALRVRKHKNRRLRRTCTDCGATTTRVLDTKYRSRNEKSEEAAAKSNKSS